MQLKFYAVSKSGKDQLTTINVKSSNEAFGVLGYALGKGFTVHAAWLKSRGKGVQIFPSASYSHLLVQPTTQVPSKPQTFICPSCGNVTRTISIKCFMDCGGYASKYGTK